MDLCAVKNRPVLIHTNEPVGHVYQGKTPLTLAQIYGLIQRFCNVRIVLAHWGGGLLFYGLMKKEVRESLQNVFFDTAASPFLYDCDIYRIAVDIVGADKILFGSDYPLLSPTRYFSEMENTGLDPTHLEKIRGESARRLLNL